MIRLTKNQLTVLKALNETGLTNFELSKAAGLHSDHLFPARTALEENGFMRSWLTEKSGPRTMLYAITPSGQELLDAHLEKPSPGFLKTLLKVAFPGFRNRQMAERTDPNSVTSRAKDLTP
jgi:DNA-binding PadR family transcriptional regulator